MNIETYRKNIESVETREMECFEAARNEWLAAGQEYAPGYKPFFEPLIRPYTCLVGICIKIK